ncbi:Imm21 family immunity protein [Streptomyces sp. NPDC053728]|uniref:Imm21 family immunity protein n=1 Tax=Streptomyces sp. NPDC053728 TaxID=3155534 RepID=UPI00341A0269
MSSNFERLPPNLSGRGPARLWLPSGVSGGRQTTCFLPKKRVFVRWLAADSEAEVFTAAEAVLPIRTPLGRTADCGSPTAWQC